MIKLSVIIPTRNRADLLQTALTSLLDQELSQDRFEVIVVDNGSVDTTGEVAQKFSSSFDNFRYIYESRPGLHKGRHAGLHAAKSNVLVYADDDIRATQSWLLTLDDIFTDQSVVLAGGNNLPDFETTPPTWVDKLWEDTPWGRVCGIYSLIDFQGGRKEISPLNVYGCNFSIRKSALINAGGFHPDGMPDKLLRYRGDGETGVSTWLRRNGHTAVFDPDATVYHLVSQSRMSPEYLRKRGFLQGVSASYSAIRDLYSMTRWHQIRYCYFLWKRLFLLWYPIINKYDSDIQNDFLKGHFDGFRFHMKEAIKDPSLRNWIVRESYLTSDD